jgi:serine/threonine protein phosphatase PrpC
MQVLTSTFIHPGNLDLQDRLAVIETAGRLLLTVADGAGGITGGAEAADLFLCSVRQNTESLKAPRDCLEILAKIDQDLERAPECGQTTGVIAVIGPEGISGASVGDSLAWFFSRDEKIELTRGQQRKPFLGTGAATIVPFSLAKRSGTIVVGTDGLWKYTSLELIEAQVREWDPGSLAHRLSELVRLRSGTFPDDIGIVTCHFSL